MNGRRLFLTFFLFFFALLLFFLFGRWIVAPSGAALGFFLT
jgi:hypothetical protein